MGQLHPTARAPRTFHKDFDFVDGPLDEVDTDSIDSMMEAKKHAMLTDYLEVARMSVLRDAISICYKQYGVNHAMKCRPIYIEYLRRLEQKNHIKIYIDELHPPKPSPGEGQEEEKAGTEE